MAGYGDTPQTPSTDEDDDNNDNNNNNNNVNGGFTDEDDDINMNNNNNNASGGFHETVIDDMNNISINKDDDDDNDDNDNWIMIDHEGKTTQVPLSSAVRTFGDIKNYLIENIPNVDLTSSHYIVDTEQDHEYQDEDDAFIASGKKLVIRWNAFFIRIMDGSDFNATFRVAADFTIQRIKDQVKNEKNIRLETLSKDGLELQNDKTLKDYDIYDNGHTLISRICLQIIDNLCTLSTEILVCEFWSIEDVLNKYLQTTRREKHLNSTLLLNNQELDLKSTVYDENIENRQTLIYSVGKYTVLVYDSDNNNMNQLNHNNNNSSSDIQAIEIEVMDNQTVKEIQESYSRLTRKPFMKNDKLLSNERELEDNVQLFRLRIKDNEPLIIEREQQQKPSQYICAECGSIVSLRPYDAVQCRECFHQIVYKQRTKRICQYNCR